MNEYVIDISDERFKGIPVSLNDEVLLEKTFDNGGKVSGYITTSVDKIMFLKTKTDIELEQMGWLRYKHILDSF